MPARVASRSARPLPAILFAPKIRNPRMAKARTAYVCSECGADFNKWQGQCGACGAWDTLSEIVLESAAAQKSPASRRRSEEHTSELQSLMRISYAVFCLKKKIIQHEHSQNR